MGPKSINLEVQSVRPRLLGCTPSGSQGDNVGASQLDTCCTLGKEESAGHHTPTETPDHFRSYTHAWCLLYHEK
jgi:hypothetical protein